MLRICKASMWMILVAGSILVTCTASGAAEPKEERAALATIMSGKHLDASRVVRVPAPGGKLLVQHPARAAAPLRTNDAIRRIMAISDPALKKLAHEVVQQLLASQLANRIIDDTVTARRMDSAFMNEIVRKSEMDQLKNVFEGFEDKSAGETIKKGIRDFVKDVFLPVYQVGAAEKARADIATRLDAHLQRLWESNLLDAMKAQAGPEFAAARVIIARTKFVNDIGNGTAVSWRGLCASNVGSQNLTNVTVAVKLTAETNRTLNRTYFFPTLKAGQTFVLYMNDREWGEVGHTATSKSLLAEILVLADQGRQSSRTFELKLPTGGHLARGESIPVTAQRPQSNSGTKPGEKAPSLEGTWVATFKNGAKVDFEFSHDRRFTGLNGTSGTWSQTERSIQIVVKSVRPEITWTGELDATGKRLTATSSTGGSVTAIRK